MKTLLDSVPEKYKLRDCQVQALSAVEAEWDKYNVFIINSPVASGKSLMAVTLAHWVAQQQAKAAIITPQTLLQDQYTEEFKKIPSLKGKAHYKCSDKDIDTCDDMYTACEKYCAKCPYVKAKKAITEQPIGIFNLYSYMLDDNPYADVLIIDEAHSVINQMQDFYTIKLWQHEDGYPDGLNTQGDAVLWMEKYVIELEGVVADLEKIEDPMQMDNPTKVAMKRKIAQLTKLIRGINRDPGHFFYENKMADYRGSKRHCIEIRPVTLQHTSPSFWRKHKKIIMMSATIHESDIEYLGIAGLRCKYIEVESPIPKENRPIVVRPTAMMSYTNQPVAIPKVCEEINKLLDENPGKGLIHLSYNLVPHFKKLLTSDRFIWHTQATRLKAYKQFREDTTDKVLVACGMSEGIDLAGLDYSWQVIAKIMFPSLGDALVQRQKEREPHWYNWQTVRTTIQQTGRICRTPTDFGVTYILDTSFNFLYFKNKHLFPKYIHEALTWKPRKKEISNE
jgi:Rad3-related DNA helicase